MHRLTILLGLVVVALAACGPNHEHQRELLQQLSAKNSADSLLTDDSLALSLANHFDSHGNCNERMLANYLLGRTYYDCGKLPNALKAFRAAAACADTTRRLQHERLGVYGFRVAKCPVTSGHVRLYL